MTCVVGFVAVVEALPGVAFVVPLLAGFDGVEVLGAVVVLVEPEEVEPLPPVLLGGEVARPVEGAAVVGVLVAGAGVLVPLEPVFFGGEVDRPVEGAGELLLGLEVE